MIRVEDFLTFASEICAENPSYKKGRFGSDGYCDCIGLIIGAIRRAGGEWKGLHGSNYAARSEVRGLKKVVRNADMKPGEVVFKAYNVGDTKYRLPDRYDTGGMDCNGDYHDYYHVGIVRSVYPLEIIHMTSPKPKTDTSIGKWEWHGELKKIDYGSSSKEEKPMGKVVIAGGNVSAKINMREAGSTGSRIIAEIPQGAEAELIEGGGTWNRIEWNGKKGYVMSSFVHREETSSEDYIRIPRKEAEQIYDMIGDWLGLRG